MLGVCRDARRRASSAATRFGSRADVTAGARALLTTQASTKVYRSLAPFAAEPCTATVAADALLAVVPDPIVCFADADFTQTQRYDLHADASLVVVDWITSGRHAVGRTLGVLALRKPARHQTRRAADRSSTRSCSSRTSIPSLERMGRFDVLLTAVMYRTARRRCRRRILVESFRRRRSHRMADLVVSAARLRDGGALLRMAGVERRTDGRSAARALRLSVAARSATISGAENGDLMHLTPHELDKLALHQAGYLAQKRLARGAPAELPRGGRAHQHAGAWSSSAMAAPSPS